jgi:hypothetical protein
VAEERFTLAQEPKMWQALTKLTGSEKKMVLDYFYYALTTEDLIEMLLNRSNPQDIIDLVEVLKREANG